MALKEQMEMFEDGGLMQEGGTVDPMSGNDVPVGSTQEEVRDDIPAQLSEGEFVFPADVVRYIGLEKLMQMRQEAKRGLEMMDKMGQMGNSDEAVIPDDIPFDMSDLDMEDDGMLEYAQGGVVNAQMGTYVPPGLYNPQPQFGISGYQPSQFQTFSTMPMPPTGNQPVMQPTMPTQPPLQRTGNVLTSSQYTPVSTTPISTGTNAGIGGLSELGPPDEFKTYRNEAGLEIQVPFKNGVVLSTFKIPEGYTLASEQKKEEPVISTGVSEPVGTVYEGSDDSTPSSDPIISGKKGQFSTTDMRGIGYDRGVISDAAKAGSKIDEELLNELDVISKGQLSDVGPVAAGLFGLSPTAVLKQAGKRGAEELGLGKFKETKGVNSNREFLTSQKVAMDATLSGINNIYGGSRSAFEDGNKSTPAGQRLHELSPEVKRSLVDALKTNREELQKSLKGKTAEDLRNEINNTQEGLGKDIKDLGISKTLKDSRGEEREKTYGQLFAEARATKSARDKLANQYGFDAKGMSMSEARAKSAEIQEASARREAAYLESVGGYSQGDDGGMGGFTVSDGRGGTYTTDSSGTSGAFTGGPTGMEDEYDFNKGGLAQQMKQSGLASKK